MTRIKETYLQRNFHSLMAISFWILMMVGFSDNWLWDTKQDTNFIPKYIIHSITAFSWFTILVIQNILIKNKNVRIHKSLGLVGMFSFIAMILSLAYLDVELYREFGGLDKMSLNTSIQAVIASIIIGKGYLNRKSDLVEHKFQMTFGTFCLIQPAMNRTSFYISDEYFFVPFIGVYLALIFYIVWYKRKLKWYMILWFLVWLYFFYDIFFNY